MPSKKRKYNARFPAGRIKRIMQADEEVGKIAQAVPVIISRTLELFVESLLTKSSSITVARNAKTLSPSHLKQCIMSEQRFDFLKDLVKTVPDIGEDVTNTPEDLSVEATALPSTHNGTDASRSLLRSQSLQVTVGAPSSSSSAMQRSLSIQPAHSKPSSSSSVMQRSLSIQPAHSTPSSSSLPGSSSNPSQYHQLQQQKFYLNNYTNHQNVTSHKPNSEPRAKISRLNSSPATATITSEQLQQNKQLPAPLNFPIQISYNIDGSSSSAMDSPSVKIDYSKFTLPVTSPSIKIDLSSFNQQVNNKPAASSTILDEDYDA